ILNSNIMKARRPRSAGSKHSGEKRSYSKAPSPGNRRRDGDSASPGRGKDASDRPYKSRSAGSGYSKGPEREGYRKSSGDDRPGKRRSGSSVGSYKKRTYGKTPWASKPESRLD